MGDGQEYRQLAAMADVNHIDSSGVNPEVLWEHPDPQSTTFWRFKDAISKKYNVEFGPETSESSLWRWSINNIQEFWEEVWDFTGIKASRKFDKVVDVKLPMHPRPPFFTGAKLNFAENLLYPAQGVDENEIAVISVNEISRNEFSWKELRKMVAQVQASLKRIVTKGDIVVGYCGNHIHAVVAMLAATSLGCVWSGISPDMGPNAVLERLEQLHPAVMFADNAVLYNGKFYANEEKIATVVKSLQGLRRVVVLDVFKGLYETGGNLLTNAPYQNYEEFLENVVVEDHTMFQQFEADIPVYILFSSGTTGRPKCICHGAIGTLIQHKKEHYIHSGIDRNAVFFQYTTIAWMMWHWLISGLASGATIVCYDGSPFSPLIKGNGDLAIPTLLEELSVTHFGTSAKYLSILEQKNVQPRAILLLKNLKVIFSTASPLAPSTFRYVYKAFGNNIQLSSITGGTDIISLFGAPNPLVPVYCGWVQSPGLGMAIAAWSSDGNPVEPGESGELVCVKHFPSMPVKFWNDEDNEIYKASYFNVFKGVWRHGDFVRFKAGASAMEMLGRADGVLNPAGVRFGSSEIYNLLLRHFPSEIEDSLCVGRRRETDLDEDVLLFVKMIPGNNFTEDLISRIKTAIRSDLSSRHVPSQIVEVPEIPITGNGKKVEIVVKQIVSGTEKGVGASVANAECLDWYRKWARSN